MKKLITMLLALALCISLAACGSQPNTVGSFNTSGNSNTGNTLPSEPIEEPENAGANDSAPAYTSIELTTENWDTYFELVEVPYFTETANGEAVRLNIQHYYKLKSEYTRAPGTDTNIIISYSYMWGYRECFVDFDAKSYTLGTEFIDAYSVLTASVTEDCFRYLDRIGTFGVEAGYECSCGKGETAVVNQYCANFQILQVQGQLYLEH